jgi:hypothetical protein
MAAELAAHTDLPDDQAEKYLDLPLGQMADPGVDSFLAANESALRQLDLAAYRDQCRWDPTLGQEDLQKTLLPHMNAMRGLANLLAVRLRSETAHHRFADAIRTLQSGFALSKNLEPQAVYVQSQVGIGMSAMFLSRMQDLEQDAGSPNLYWALAELPHPFMDFSQTFENEQTFFYSNFPALRLARRGELAGDQWGEVLAEVSSLGPTPEKAGEAAGMIVLATMYPDARQFVVAHGLLPENESHAASQTQVTGMYLYAQYEDLWDQMYMAGKLPYPKALEKLRVIQDQAKADKTPNPFTALLSVLSVQQLILPYAQLDREIALHQCVEGIRSYAASHDGKPPAKLEDMADTPAPLDPMTGKAFGYSAAEDTAAIEAAAPQGYDPARYGEIVRVTVIP